MVKRILMMALAVMMLMSTGACGAFAEETAAKEFVLAGFDDTEYRNWTSNLFFERIEKMTGVQFELKQYKKDSEWAAFKAGLEKGGELPDVLFKAGLTTPECISLYEKGVLIDLKPYLEANCPNLWAYLQENEEAMDAISLPGGQIVALPYINEIPVQNYLWVNKTWLDKAGKEMPADKEALEDVLRTFRDLDMNQNGKDDEVPLGFMGPFDLKFLGHAFGLVANDYNIYVEDGQVKYLPFAENFRPFLEWCKGMYAEGLLEKDGFIISSNVRNQMITSDEKTPIYGFIITPMAQDAFRTEYADEYEIVMPLMYEGKQVYRDFSGHILRGTFAVTSACQNVEKVLSWVDYLYSPEGNILVTAGLENEDYYYHPDGTWSLTEATAGNTYFSIMALISGGATTPGRLNADFQRKYADDEQLLHVIEKQDQFANYLVRPFPYYSLTEEEAAQVNAMQMELGAYVDTMMGRFIRGDEELNDETYAHFITALEEKGADAFIAFWQQIYEAL